MTSYLQPYLTMFLCQTLAVVSTHTHFLPFCGSCPSKLACSSEIPEITLGTCDKIHQSERVRTARPEKKTEVPGMWGGRGGKVGDTTNIALTSALFPTTKFPVLKPKSRTVRRLKHFKPAAIRVPQLHTLVYGAN